MLLSSNKKRKSRDFDSIAEVEVLKGLVKKGGSVAGLSDKLLCIDVAEIASQTCQALREAFFCFVFFVVTKKMTLLSGNPDGFAYILGLQSPTKRATD